MKKIKQIIIYISVLAIIFSCVKNSDNFTNYQNNVQTSNKKLDKNNYKISTQEAEIFAQNFIYTHFKNKSNTSIKKINIFPLPILEKILYLIEVDPEGFILLSDDKRNIPVLAFSETDDFSCKSFEELPNGAKEWISETLLLNHKLETNPKSLENNDIIKQWNLYLSDTITSINSKTPSEGEWDCYEYYDGHVLQEYNNANLTTSWRQRLPYNLHTPICHSGEYSGQHKPTGCVATSMAQIMNFWEYPSNFNWDIMQNAYYQYDTSTSAHEVATLMHICGLMSFMNYGCDSSGTTHDKAKDALKNSFNYNNSIEHDDYSYFDVKSELKQGRPVILGGYRTKHSCCGLIWYTNGHSWVADGFREEYDRYIKVCDMRDTYGSSTSTTIFYRNYRYWMHMNWGWGIANAWYFSNELTQPSGLNRNYKWKKDMIINIHP